MKKPVVGILVAGALLATLPWLGLPAFYESLLYLFCHWIVLALSWNILSGYSGYFSFGHGAFFLDLENHVEHASKICGLLRHLADFAQLREEAARAPVVAQRKRGFDRSRER